jgi:hypothetical protein
LPMGGVCQRGQQDQMKSNDPASVAAFGEGATTRCTGAHQGMQIID